MRFTSAPLFKSAVLYGLLAAAHALPTSIAPKDEKRRSLDLRMVPVKPLTPKPVAKPPPSRPAGSPHDGPEVAPPPRLGADPVAPGSGDNTRLDGKPKKDIAVSGADNLKALDNKLKESPVKSRDFKDYDAKIGKYTVDEYKPFEFSVSPDKAKWYTDNGIPSEPGPEVKGVDIYGAKNVDLDAPDLAPAWSGAVDPVNGVQIRNGEFRTGQAGNMKADDYYRDIPEKERIFISDIIARNQKDYGGGRPMSKNVSALGIFFSRKYGVQEDPLHTVSDFSRMSGLCL